MLHRTFNPLVLSSTNSPVANLNITVYGDGPEGGIACRYTRLLCALNLNIIFICCFWTGFTSTVPVDPVRGFAGSRRRPAMNSPNSPMPLRGVLHILLAMRIGRNRRYRENHQEGCQARSAAHGQSETNLHVVSPRGADRIGSQNQLS